MRHVSDYFDKNCIAIKVNFAVFYLRNPLICFNLQKSEDLCDIFEEVSRSCFAPGQEFLGLSDCYHEHMLCCKVWNFTRTGLTTSTTIVLTKKKLINLHNTFLGRDLDNRHVTFFDCTIYLNM